VAWGFTNGFPDVQDLYIEHLRRPDDGRVQYEFQGEWHDAEVRREEIRVKGGQAAVEEVIVTRHGPIIDSLAPELASYAAFKPEFDSGLNAAKHGVWSGLALRWTALEPSQTFLALHGMNRARSCAGFREALRYWSCPVQNTVYADTARNIAYSFPGLVPIRAKGDGQVPVPGWTGEYEWTGYVPFDELPHLVNPPQGYIATANNRVTGDDYPYFIGRAFCVGDRAQRIIELIESREKLDVPFIRRMHFDQISPTGRAVAAILANLTTDDPELGVVIALVRGWDGDLRPDSAAAAIYEVFMRRLLMVLLEGKLGQLAVHYAGKGPTPLLAETSMFGHLSWHWLATILGQPDSHWFTHVAGAGLPAAASQQQIRNEVLCRVLRETVDYLKAELGPNVHAWTWCRLHTLTYSHSLSSVPALAKLFNRGPYPLGGDDSTVWATGAGFHDAKGRSVIGPPFRFIADLGDWRNCLGLLTPGQSANPASPHYDDQAQAWFTGEYHPMLWERADVECEAKGRLRLTPQLGAEQNTHYAHPR
jgi:penicillin amidase